jgi:hypothetical protein
LRREVCSIFDQLNRGFFKKPLKSILALPLTHINIEVSVHIVHEKATNYSDLSVLANLSDAMIRILPTETGVKTTGFLMEQCKKLFMAQK